MNNPQTSPTANNPAGKPPSGASFPPLSPSERKEHHRLTWILIVLVCLLAAGAFFLLRGGKPPQQAPRAISITVTNVSQGDIQVAVSALGTVQPVYTVAITPRVDGQIMSVNYTEGQMVNTNDLLVVIDPRPYQALKLEAEGQLARDNALLEGATVDLARYKSAYVKKAIPEQQYADQVALVHQDEGTVRYDEGQVSNAAVQLDYCYVRAPIAGRVGLRLIDPGNVVHAANSNALLNIAELQPITVVFDVAEDYLPQIQSQMSDEHPMVVEAYDRSMETKIATGEFLALDNLIDSATGTIRIKAIFTNDDMTLFPNQFVNARMIIQTLQNVDLIPTYAIQRNPEGAFVYVITNSPNSTNQEVTMRNITTGTSDGNVTAVSHGLRRGDLIALDNFNKLGEGVKVVVRKPGHEGQSGNGKHRGGSSYGKKEEDPKESQ